MITLGRVWRGSWAKVVGWSLAGVVSYGIATCLLLVAIVLFGGAEYFSTTTGSLVARVVLTVLMIGVLWFIARTLPSSRFTRRTVGAGRQMSWRDIGLGIAGFILYAIISMIALSVATNIPGFNAGEAQQLGLTTLFGAERLIGFIVLVIITPLLEELLFRGMLFGKIHETTIGFWPTALIVSLLFAVAHGQWNVGVDVFCLSMVACYLRESTGAIWAGVLLHMVKNMIAFYFTFMLMQGVGS